MEKKDCYRALTFPFKKIIYVYFNEGETIESLKWLIAHELSHANLRNNPFIEMTLQKNFKEYLEQNKVKSQTEYENLLKNDKFHENMLEEQICNSFATTIVGFNYDRTWWRNQFKQKVS